MHEVVKIVGGVTWLAGFVFLFIVPVFGVAILAVALLLSVWSVQKTREKRHAELLDSVRERGF